MIHTKEKPFDCPKCPAAFRRKTHLQNHINCVHTKIRPYPCTLCSKVFSNRGHQNSHMLIHVNEFPYKCEICAKRFRHPSSLDIHNKAHRKGSLYLCSRCLTPFATQVAFESHYLKIHVGCDDNVLQCFFCEKVFKNRWYLENHAHTKERPYSCILCPTTYTEKRMLTEHLNRHRKFPQQMMSQNHHKSRCFICIFCSKNMKTWANWLDTFKLTQEKNHFPAKFVGSPLQQIII